MAKWTRRDILKFGVAAPVLADALNLRPAPRPLSGAPASQRADAPSPAATRERLLLDFGWRFHLGHADDPSKDFGFGQASIFAKSGWLCEAARPDFNDRDWRVVNLPHDWAVELPFENAPELRDYGYKPLGRRFPATSIGWYRRVFEIPSSDRGKRLWLEFDGVFRDSIVALNGHYIGRNLSGYAPSRYDITDFANYGGKNVLAVRVDATEHEGWFYEGAGIYRHVWLVKTNPVHVAHWGTYVTSDVQPDAATLTISTEIDNDSDAEESSSVLSTILDSAGKEIATARSEPAKIPAWSRREFKQQMMVKNPALWSLEEPHMYRLLTVVESSSAVVDSQETPFGIRTILFHPHTGFFLDGKPVQIKATCNHQDHAGVGSALPDRLQFYRIAKLKEMGSNGYRTSHNPPTPELLDACDRLGMLVMDETRMMSSSREGLSQLERMIRRDRNHPCIVLWSLGNEEPEQGTSRGERIVTTMKRLVRKLDPTRPVTVAMNGAWGRGVSSVVDVQGFNYAGLGGRGGPKTGEHIDEFHKQFPRMPTIGSETASDYTTRGIYANDKEKGYVSAYDVNFPAYTLSSEGWWKVFDERAFLAGGFAWTGFDYRGEPSPYDWPCISSHFGIMDTCGFPKDNYYYYQAWWSQKPVLHLFPHWNWRGKEGREIEVRCHTNLDAVELFLNGKSLGSKTVERDSHVEWKVKYVPGVLEARGWKNGHVALTDKRETTGSPAKILLRPDRQTIAADGEDVSVVAVEVVDAQGRVVPDANNEIAFRAFGQGEIIGVGNGDPSCHEPDKAEKRSAFNGLCMAIVQATKEPGEIRFEATSPGFESATVVIRCESATPRPAIA